MLAKPSNQLAPPLRRARFRPSERQRANACIHLVLGDVETHDNAIILCHHPAPFLARSGLEAPATVRVEEDTGSVPRSPSGSPRPLSTNGLRSSDGRLVRTARSHILPDSADTRSRRKPLKPLRAGMPGQSGEPTVTTSCALYPFCTRDCGCIKHPAFPTPFIGRSQHAQLGRIRAARTRTHMRPSSRKAKRPQPVIPGRCAASSPESTTPDRGYGFRACAQGRIHDVQLHIGESRLCVLSCRLHNRHSERNETIHLPCGCAMDCFASLAMTMDRQCCFAATARALASLAGCLKQTRPRRPAQAKRDAGPITTGRSLCGSHRTASLKRYGRQMYCPAAATPVIASAAKQSIFLADVPWIASLRSQ